VCNQVETRDDMGDGGCPVNMGLGIRMEGRHDTLPNIPNNGVMTTPPSSGYDRRSVTRLLETAGYRQNTK